MKNYLTYPCKYINISQNYNSRFSHSINSTGTPSDFPIDEACKDSGRDWFFCPCDEMEVKRIYGVNNGGTNTLWLESTSKVDMPIGTDYVTILVMHPEDDDLRLLSVGQKFKRGEQICREGKDGMATGYHFHMSFGTGHMKGNGWIANNKEAWVLLTDGKNIKPEEACYIDPSFTTIMNMQNLNFKTLPFNNEEKVNAVIGIDVSKHNGPIEWSSVPSKEVNFVMVRAGFGSNESQVDTRFRENVEGALKAGLHVGAYWFSYALNLDDVKKEAELFAKTLEPYKGKMDFPVFYDLEYDSFNYAKKYDITITKEIATEFALTFCSEMNKMGWLCGNYTNYDCYIRYFDSNKMKHIDTWLADWRHISEPSVTCTIWQYSNTGTVKGISGNVDMNICYKDYPTFIINNGWNGFEAKNPTQENKDVQFLLDEIDMLKTKNNILESNILVYKNALVEIQERINEVQHLIK